MKKFITVLVLTISGSVFAADAAKPAASAAKADAAKAAKPAASAASAPKK